MLKFVPSVIACVARHLFDLRAFDVHAAFEAINPHVKHEVPVLPIQ